MQTQSGKTEILAYNQTTPRTSPLQVGTFLITATTPFQFLEGDLAFFNLSGYSKSSLANAVLATFIYQQDVEAVYSEITNQLKVSNEVHICCNLKKADESLILVQIDGTFFQLNNALSVLRCTVAEHTPDKAITTEAVPTISNVESFSMNMGCSFSKHLLDHQLTILWANPFFYQLADYSKEEWYTTYGTGVLDIIYRKDLAAVINRIADITENDSAQIHFRIYTKNGSLRWIHAYAGFSGEMQGNTRIINLVLCDITPIMRTENLARIAMEQYRTLSNISEEIAFEYSFGTDTLEFANRYAKCFDFAQYIENPKATLQETKYISADTRDTFNQFLDTVFHGATSGQAEFQILENNGTYSWYVATFAAIFDENQNQIKSIGLLRNIEAQKQEQEKLLKKSQLDTATELYNKAATEHFVKKSLTMLNTATTDAIMIIDIDDFKNINDTYGHLEGDEAILEIANAMKAVVTTNDLPGRIGGDEFAIYFRDILDTTMLTEKAETIANRLRKAYPGGNDKPKVTLSIGIATAKSGTTYEQLLEHADTALYRAKAKGKNCNVLYIEEMERDQYINQRESSKLSMYQELSNALIEASYRAGSVDNAVSQIFAILGNNLPIDKIGIFEHGKNHHLLNCTYQWNKNPLDSTKGKEQGILSAPFVELYNLGNNGIFYTQDTRNITMVHRESVPDPSYVCKLAITKLEYNNQIIGYLSVASKNTEQGWSEDILNLLTLTTRLLTPQIKLRQTEEKLTQFHTNTTE